jgi:hypothetical protein
MFKRDHQWLHSDPDEYICFNFLKYVLNIILIATTENIKYIMFPLRDSD